MRFLTLLIPLILISPVQAQQSPLPEAGARVRVSTSGSSGPVKIIGRFSDLTPDHVVIRRWGDAELLIPRGLVTRLEVSRGKRFSALTGLGIGFVAGAGIGALVGARAIHGTDLATQDAALMGAAGLGILGALIGTAVAGASERWQNVPLAQQ